MPRDLVNHVALVVDRSESMLPLRADVVRVVDQQVRHLADLSKEADQETRVSVFLFDDAAECVVWDKDVLRLPSIEGLYQPRNRTALIDATLLALTDLDEIPRKHGDHAFLVYVVTDGQENQSRTRPETLAGKLAGLHDGWTVACLVPDKKGEIDARRFGFPEHNVMVWETTRAGLVSAADTVKTATRSWMTGRSQGLRSTRTLFRPDTSKLDQATVNRTLRRLSPADYQIHEVIQGPVEIAPFVEVRTGRPYQRGAAFYRLTKRETIQPGKEVVLVHKRTDVAYGGSEARQLLGLPDHEVKVEPADTPDYEVFVQSTSVNRKLAGGERVLVRL